MNHLAVHLKLTQHCKSTILQLKKKITVRYHFTSTRMAVNLKDRGTSLEVQWLRFHASTAGITGLIPG